MDQIVKSMHVPTVNDQDLRQRPFSMSTIDYQIGNR